MKNILLLLSSCLFLFSLSLYSQPESQTFNASGIYTVPAGYTATITVEVWGGGGGGGTNMGGRDGGGGGGAYASTTFDVMATSAVNYTVTVGGGGSPGTNGENSSFTGPSVTIIALGGSGATGSAGANGGSGTGSTGTIKWSGGNGGSGGSGAPPNGGGGGGGSATTLANGNNGDNNSGNTGGAGGTGEGNGGAGGNNNANGAGGIAPGGGGGGKGNGSSTSGSGAPGRVVVTVNSFLLPIELLSFSGKRTGSAIQLHWRTATERNNAYMEVQRSKDGKRFEALQQIPSKTGGNSNTLQDYTFTDEKPLAGVNYYRLRQADFDGKEEYHRVIAVLFREGKSEGTLQVFPTLAQDQITLALPRELQSPAEVLVSDLNGRVLLRHTLGVGTQQHTLPLAQLASGHYILRIRTDREEQIARFVKE